MRRPTEASRRAARTIFQRDASTEQLRSRIDRRLVDTQQTPNRETTTKMEDGRFVIDAGDGDDRIEIGRGEDGTLTVTTNGDRRSYRLADDNRVTVRGGSGNDSIRVEDGADMSGIDLRIEGGEGDDRIRGGDHGDELLGGDGNDEIEGGKGDDFISGGAGDDVLRGGSGRDVITGLDGNDRIEGGDFRDFIDGGRGNDIIDGGGGADTLIGGRGKDRIRSDRSDRVFQDPSGNAGHTIRVEGSKEFVAQTQSALDALRSTPSGRKLLEGIDASGRSLRIRETRDDNGYAASEDDGAFLKPDGTRGPGSNSEIEWNPDFRGMYDGNEDWQATPPAVVLGHELVHAYNFMTGSAPTSEGDWDEPPALENLAVGLPFDHDDNPKTPKIEPAEFYRRLRLELASENTIRNDFGVPRRPYY